MFYSAPKIHIPVLALLLVALLCPAATDATTPVNYVREIYISSSEGDDANPGTIDSPKKTLKNLPPEAHNGSKIHLRRGYVLFYCFHSFTDCKIDAYGNGNDPIVSGFRVLTNPQAWEKVEGSSDIYRIDLNDNSNFKGIDKQFEINTGHLYDIGCIYIPAQDSILGHIVPSIADMKADGDIFTSQYFKADSIENHPFGTVYLKLSYNPACLGTVCFSTFRQGAATILNCHVCDLAFVGFSNHGASSDLNKSTFTNCSFDIIGGAIQIDYIKWIRYGNGIEIWASDAQDVLVENCTFSRTFDTATTIQGSGIGVTSPKKIKFLGNKMYKCRQAFEYFLRDNHNDESLEFIDCEFSNNIAYMMGNNGFNSAETRDANILSYSISNHPMTIRYNLFYGASYRCTQVIDTSLSDNTVFLYPNQYLLNNNLKPGFTIMADNTDEYRQKAPTDNSHFIVIEPGSAEDIEMKKNIEEIIGWEPPKLNLYMLTK